MLACCLCIFALRNITLGGYLDTWRNILEHIRHDVRPEIYLYIEKKSTIINIGIFPATCRALNVQNACPHTAMLTSVLVVPWHISGFGYATGLW